MKKRLLHIGSQLKAALLFYGEAITMFNKVLKINPNDPDIHFNIGESYNNWKKYEEAIASYDYYEK